MGDVVDEAVVEVDVITMNTTDIKDYNLNKAAFGQSHNMLSQTTRTVSVWTKIMTNH